MLTDPRETRDALVGYLAYNPNRLFTAHELAGELVALEKNVRAVLEDLVSERLLVKVGENYRRPIAGEGRP